MISDARPRHDPGANPAADSAKRPPPLAMGARQSMSPTLRSNRETDETTSKTTRHQFRPPPGARDRRVATRVAITFFGDHCRKKRRFGPTLLTLAANQGPRGQRSRPRDFLHSIPAHAATKRGRRRPQLAYLATRPASRGRERARARVRSPRLAQQPRARHSRAGMHAGELRLNHLREPYDDDGRHGSTPGGVPASARA